MDMFEKAHVVRNSPQNEKRIEAAKKQIKDMLCGYKINDNEMIKKSANRKIEVEDTFSMSSFTLDQNNSTTDGPEPTVLSISTDSSSVSNVEDLNLTNSTEQDSVNQDPVIEEQEDNLSISECEDDIQSLSENNSVTDNDSASDYSFSAMADFSQSSTGPESVETEPFDPEGVLASKILTKPKKRERVTKTKPVKKTKVDDIRRQIQSWQIEEVVSENENEAQSEDTSDNETSLTLETDTMTDYEIVHDDRVKTNYEDRQCTSPFVSMSASEFEDRSFTEVLSDYRHPTVKSLPHNSRINANNAEIFPSNNIVSDSETTSEISLHQSDLESITDNETETELTKRANYKKNFEIDNSPIDFVGDDSYNMDTINNSSFNIRETESIEETTYNMPQAIKVWNCNNGIIILMKHPTELYFHGKLKVTPLAGTVETFGHTLKNKEYNLFAPNYNYAQYLRTVEKICKNNKLFDQLINSGLSIFDSEEIAMSLTEYDVVLKMQSYNDMKLNFVEENFSVTDLFTKQNKNVDSYLREASNTVGCSLYVRRPMRCFQENPSWQQIINRSNKTTRGIVCGGKNTGKSTFLRYYVNKCLAQGPVLVIDLDPGQCEFTVAGNISAMVVTEPLLGPNFTHLQRADRTLNIGNINVMDNLKRYKNAVASLLAYCANEPQYNSIPWIVNTMGMCNGLGLKLTTYIILLVKPTFLIQMDSNNSSKRYDRHLDPENISTLVQTSWDPSYKGLNAKLNYQFYLSSNVLVGGKTGFSLAARDERYLNFLAYFGEVTQLYKCEELLKITPYQVPLYQLKIGSNVRIDPEAILKVINGKIIALCKHTETDNNAKMFTLADKPLLCFGHGLIRAVNVEYGMLYIITPEPMERLMQVDCILYMDWAPELRIQEQRLPVGTVLPHRTVSQLHHKPLMVTPRRRFNPLQLLKAVKK